MFESVTKCCNAGDDATPNADADAASNAGTADVHAAAAPSSTAAGAGHAGTVPYICLLFKGLAQHV